MEKRFRGAQAKRMSEFIHAFIPRFILFGKNEQNYLWNLLWEETEINIFIRNPKVGTFEKLAMYAKKKNLLYKILAPEDLQYFPHTTNIKDGYFVRLFKFFPGEEAKVQREMNVRGYRHGTGCELLHLVLENKFHIKDVDIIALGTVARPDRKEGKISPMLNINKEEKMSIDIHDHKIYGSPSSLFYLGVLDQKKIDTP